MSDESQPRCATQAEGAAPRLFGRRAVPENACDSGKVETSQHVADHPPPPPPLAFQADAQLPVLLLHGVLGSHRSMQGIQDALTQAGIESLSLDLLGFGQSTWDAEEYDVDAHIAAIMASTSHWQEYVVVGHSFGSLLGQELLVRDSTRCLGCISVATPASASLTEFYGQLCRSNPVSWFVLRAPECITWTICTLLCQQRWLWRPMASMVLAPLLAFIPEFGALSRVLLEDFFDHSHKSFCGSVHCSLVPLLTRPLPKKVNSGRTVFMHGDKDAMCPLQNLRRKLGSSHDCKIVVVAREGHLSILQRADVIAAATVRLRAKVRKDLTGPSSK